MTMRTTRAFAAFWVAIAIPGVTSKARGQGEDIRAVEVLMEGRALATEHVAELEKRLVANPDDLDSRTRLLGYYWSRQFEHPEEAATRQGHVFWIVEHAPGTGVAGSVGVELDAVLEPAAYQEGSRLWRKQAEDHANEPVVLGNAANYFLIHDSARAEEFYKKARALDPDSPKWARRLAQVMSLRMIGASDEKRAGLATEALRYREESVALDKSPQARSEALCDLAELACEAREWKKARSYATELVEQASSAAPDQSGDAAHAGNTVLGRLALRDGDLEEAKRRLLDSGAVSGSPGLDTSGPSMVLAEELLRSGERDAVLEYLGRCTRFWKGDRGRLDLWAKDIREGRTPDFGSQGR